MALRGDEIRKKIVEEVDKLPEERLPEVLDYVGHLVTRTTKEVPESQLNLDPTQDPILKLIGIADVAPFAHEIDTELYGG